MSDPSVILVLVSSLSLQPKLPFPAFEPTHRSTFTLTVPAELSLQMDFTEVYKQTSQLVIPSPNGLFLATAVSHRLVIRDSDSLQILHLFACTDAVQEVQWSNDSHYVLCASYKLGLVQVWSLQDKEWTCKIEAGAEGLEKVRWAPDGRSIMCFSEFQLRVTIWSLVDREAAYIQYPKYTDRACTFRRDGRYLALAERRDTKDYVSVYDAEDWTMLKHWPVDTDDLEDISWSPDGRFIAVWDTSLEYRVLIYYPDGRLVKSFSAYDNMLGVKSVSWSPSGQFLAVGSYDGKVRLLNHYTWTPMVEFSHPTNLEDVALPVFKEIDLRDTSRDTARQTMIQGQPNTDWVNGRPKLRFQLVRPPYTLPRTKPDSDKPNPKMGVGVLQWSSDGRFLVTRHDSSPHSIYVWSLPHLSQIALIHHTNPVKHLLFNPVHCNLLTWCCGNGYVYVARLPLDEREDEGVGVEVEAVEIPAVGFACVAVKWLADGKGIVVMDKDKFSVGFLVEGEA